jgi:hypothetical protein
MKKVCPKCGKEFECKHTKECFCMKYILTKQELHLLKEKYDDCLCEECLKSICSNKVLQDK